MGKRAIGEVSPSVWFPWEVTCGHFPQDKAKVEIRKLNDPPKAEAIRDMVRYARNVIEEFRRAKHYKYILYNQPSLTGGVGEFGHGERGENGFQILNIGGRMCPGKCLKTYSPSITWSQLHQHFMMLTLSVSLL